MAQGIETATQTAPQPEASSGGHGGGRLGALLCWAVVFADIGTSVYYVPGILHAQVGALAGFFVTLTLGAFVLLALKYAEVTVRFPEGGGVVTVAAHGLNPWFGAVGGMFILVDYFLTSAISSLSGVQYLETLVPGLSAPLVQLAITVVLVMLLGVLNWWGIKESAGVSFVIAIAALISDMLILTLIVAKVPVSVIGKVFAVIFSGEHLTLPLLITGFAGAFLAFSGLESISQLSPVMRTPRHKTVTIALLLVVVTVGVTSPLLTTFSTVLLTHPQLMAQTHLLPLPPAYSNLHDPNVLNRLRNEFISQLGYAAGGRVLEVLTAITASTLLLFASNTAIIGAYHVFLALSRMQFFPRFVERTNKFRGTPHISIILATVIPIAVLIGVGGNITILGDMYAFGLLGAFTLTCVSLDVIRWREKREHTPFIAREHEEHSDGAGLAAHTQRPTDWMSRFDPQTVARLRALRARVADRRRAIAAQAMPATVVARRWWPDIKLYLGFLTSVLVGIAWVTNLYSKPLATAFGGTLTVLGVAVSVVHYNRQRSIGEATPMLSTLWGGISQSALVVLTSEGEHNLAVARAAVESTSGRKLVFLYVAQPTQRTVRLLQFNDPYLYDEDARALFTKIAALCARAHVEALYAYRVGDVTSVVPELWRRVRPEEIIAEAGRAKRFSKEIAPEYVRFQQAEGVRVVHVVPRPLGGGSGLPTTRTGAPGIGSGLPPRVRAVPDGKPFTTGERGRPSDSGIEGATNGHVEAGALSSERGKLKNEFGRPTQPPHPATTEAQREPKHTGVAGVTGEAGTGRETAAAAQEPDGGARGGEPQSVNISDYVWVGTQLVRKEELEREPEQDADSDNGEQSERVP